MPLRRRECGRIVSFRDCFGQRLVSRVNKQRASRMLLQVYVKKIGSAGHNYCQHEINRVHVVVVGKCSEPAGACCEIQAIATCCRTELFSPYSDMYIIETTEF